MYFLTICYMNEPDLNKDQNKKNLIKRRTKYFAKRSKEKIETYR